MTASDADITILPAGPAVEPLAGGGSLRRAPAKLNLALRVGPRRADRFHDIDSVVARITFYDELTFRAGDGPFGLDVTGIDCGPIEENLVHRAADLLGATGVRVGLDKRIPAGAGLGGGSSDAATALVGLNEACGLGLSADRLATAAAELGSDVPSFLGSPAARMRGRGEIVEAADVHAFWAVLVTPGINCQTGQVYAAFDELSGDRPGPEPVDVEAFAAPPSHWGEAAVNDLAEAAALACPLLGEAIERLSSAADRPVHVTGSGSGLCMFADDAADAERLAVAVASATPGTCRIVTINPW